MTNPVPTQPEPAAEGTALGPVAGASVVVTETATSAVAAQAKASVEARYLVAMKNPRDWDLVRLKVLKACKRPGFAEAARYSKPVGGKSIVGPSIRFAEEALRTMGNCLVESMAVFDDATRRIVRVTVTDLESNLSYPTDLLIEKTVERRSVRNGQQVISRRTNTRGEIVYLVEATEDELLVKQAALTSKAIRTSALRLLPGDILEEAMDAVAATTTKADAEDPEGARKRLLDAFYTLAVTPDDLAEYLGHAIDKTTPAELNLLRTIYTALRDGEATWADVLETKGKNPEFKKAGERGTDSLRAKFDPKPPTGESA